MGLEPGTRLGLYEVTGLLGEGGMGTVYRARDTRLRRDVAIKVLPDARHDDPARRARFEQEARMLAALTHPNIAAIYGIEESADGRQALVLELVDGQTLATRIAGRALPVAEALSIARQIAEALDAAHEKGIVHRDLKPGNIAITPAGVVKVLDFGIAKMAGQDQAVDETRTAGLTHEGVLVGTAAYMSPEQARGQTVDKRTDIWAFGCVLYEVLTGRSAFGRDTPSDTISTILGGEPDWNAVPKETPAPVQRLLRRCLAKDARGRLRDIGDARSELDNSSSPAEPKNGSTGLSEDGRNRRRLAAVISSAAAGGVLLGWAATRTRQAEPEKARYNSIVPPAGYSFVPLAEGGPPALSPDGQRIAYVLRDSTGMQSLWVQTRDTNDYQPLPGTAGAAAPFWSPNGDELAFFADQKLKRVKRGGGAPQELAEQSSSAGILSSQGAMPGTWSGDGIILYDRVSLLWRVSASGVGAVPETEKDVKAFDENHYGPYFLPDARHYLMLVRGGTELRLKLVIGELGSKSRTTLLENVTSAQFVPGRDGRPGHVVFVRDTKLIARPFDEQRRTLGEPEVTLANDVAVTGGGGLADFTVSPGVLAYRRGPRSTADMAWYDINGKPTGTLGDRPGHPRNTIRISPNGALVAFTRDTEKGQNVWTANTDAKSPGRPRPFTAQGGRTPVWSPDSSEIIYLRANTIYRRKLAGGVDDPVWQHDGILAINDWSGDGRQLLVTVWDTTKAGITGRRHWLLSDLSNPPVKAQPVGESGHAEFAPPRGAPQWITSDVSGVNLHSLPGTASSQVPVGGGDRARQPRWRQTGEELFFADDDNISVVTATWTPTLKFPNQPRVLFPIPLPFRVAFGQWAPGWDVHPDGQRFLVTNPPPNTPAASIEIITNWETLLERSSP